MTTKKLPHGKYVAKVRYQRRLWYMPMYYAGLRWHPHVVARGKPQLYKTFRGANRRAGDGGRVLVIDLEAMLVVTDDVHLDDRQIPEEEFAERQFGLWGEAVKRLSERST